MWANGKRNVNLGEYEGDSKGGKGGREGAFCVFVFLSLEESVF